ncbi:DUF3775 domain-containing protein [Aquabacter sediminis]|uniref:DUF3775 domain-containing protein n=1 Tax=Aquabacter sediminis TaxID=3029197 RepID=UPI00237DBBDE|nr:DUF3775 domain-containing protein [Aquabacter sp. P-9]MDE1569857.1 DUF3775 domain-containing protein [Aquabacter sp. P-9]
MADAPELSIPLEAVCFIIIKAREFDAKDVVTDPDDGSNASDDGMAAVLEDHGDDPTRAEIVGHIRALNEDEQVELVALAWLGRGDGTLADWDDLKAQAADARSGRTASYLLGMPLLADYLADGLSQFDLSCQDFEMDRL